MARRGRRIEAGNRPDLSDTWSARMSDSSSQEAFSTELVVSEILKKIESTTDFLRASFVNRTCNYAARFPDVISVIVSRNLPCFIGFMCEYAQDGVRCVKLITPPAALIDDPARFLRERFVPHGLYGKRIMGTHGARVICRVESGKKEGRFYIRRPYGLKPRLFSLVAFPIDPMPKILRDNTLGQFAVLPPDNGPGGGYPVFFVKDFSRPFLRIHGGARFNTVGRVCLQVSVFSNGVWVPHILDPLVPPAAVTFQRSPYCVQSRSRIYMMYLLDLIVWFDVEDGSFGLVHLPGQMGTVVRCCFEYTAGPHPVGDLAIVHLDDYCLVRWVLTCNGDMADWHEEARVDVVVAFGNRANNDIMDALAFDPSDWRAIQVRSVSPDGRYVLISVGMVDGLYVVDMLEGTVEAAPNLGQMGRVFAVSQTWPPRP